MKNTFISAKLVEPTLIRLSFFAPPPFFPFECVLEKDGNPIGHLKEERRTSVGQNIIIDYRLDRKIELGHSYFVLPSSYGRVSLDLSEYCLFDSFDDEFAYFGSDLGAIYSKKSTSFALWSPLSSSVTLFLRKDTNSPFSIHRIKRGPKGVYKITLEGDYEGYLYHYEVVNGATLNYVIDPYGFSSVSNGKESAVIDVNKIAKASNKVKGPSCYSLTHAIIYEGHVRDLTIDGHSNIENKGLFKGLYEKNKVNEQGDKVGFDYLTSLGFTHLQLLPVNDFRSVNENNPTESFNWGYDPSQYFTLEGSYSSNPDDPLARMKEFQQLVSSYHKAGIGIVLDVVYNHVYAFESSNFEKILPSYYFRQGPNGKNSSCSGCGNDLASERAMVRKLIVDSCLFLVKTYNIDGFRFDLMGLIDSKTILTIAKEARKINPSFLLYGEGWDMALPSDIEFAAYKNAFKLPNIGFFNDSYRELTKNYFISLSSRQEFKNAFFGSCFDFIIGRRFLSPSQSLNYVECHDNKTLFDEICSKRPNLDEQERLSLIRAINAALAFSIGVPFFHSGQEIGASKFGEDNTYNKGDKFNKLPTLLLTSRKENILSFKKALATRKKHPCFSSLDRNYIDNNFDINDIGDALKVDIKESKDSQLLLVFNPTEEEIRLPAYSSFEVEYSSSTRPKRDKDIYVLPPLSTILLKKSKTKK